MMITGLAIWWTMTAGMPTSEKDVGRMFIVAAVLLGALLIMDKLADSTRAVSVGAEAKWMIIMIIEFMIAGAGTTFIILLFRLY